MKIDRAAEKANTDVSYGSWVITEGQDLSPELQSTYELLRRAFPEGISEADYFPVLAVFADTEISSRNFSKVLECLDGRHYAEHLYLFTHELPNRPPPEPVAVEATRRRLNTAAFQEWMNEDD